MAVQAGNAGHCLEHGAAIWRAESELARVPGHVSAGEETETAAFVPSSVYITAGKCPSKSPGHGFGLSRGHKGRNAAAPGRLRSAEHPRTAPGSRVRSHLGCCHRGVRALCARGRGHRGPGTLRSGSGHGPGPGSDPGHSPDPSSGADLCSGACPNPSSGTDHSSNPYPGHNPVPIAILVTVAIPAPVPILAQVPMPALS